MAAIAGSHVVRIILYPHQIPASFQIRNDLFSCFVPIKALVLTAEGIYAPVIVQHPDHFQMMPQSDLKVVGVVGRRHLDAAGTKIHFRIVIRDNRDFLVHERQNDIFSNNILVALVSGIYADTAVAQHGFRTGCGDDHFSASIRQRIPDMPQMAGLIHIFDLSIRQRRHAVRTPVDDPASFINQSFFIQRNKDLPDSPGAAVIHGKSGTIPITGSTQLLLLLYDPVAEAVLPVPDLFKELFPPQIVPGLSLFTKLLFHLDLSRNTGVVNTGNPECIISLHPLEADQCILQSGIHGMSHVKLPRNIWWRHYDCKGLLVRIALGVEIAVLFPHVIDAALHCLGLIYLW